MSYGYKANLTSEISHNFLKLVSLTEAFLATQTEAELTGNKLVTNLLLLLMETNKLRMPQFAIAASG